MRQDTIVVSVLFVMMCLVLTSCPGDSSTEGRGKNKGDIQVTLAAEVPQYPIPLSKRPYQKVHPSVEQAWFYVETAYFVIKDKYVKANELIESENEADKQRGIQAKEALVPEIQQSVFNINPKVDQLFKDAISEESDNPLNYAAYAYYLKARKIVDKNGSYVGEGEDLAIENINKAIELWPDDAGLYLLKIHILSAPNQCHEWFRGAAGEELVLASRLDELRTLFQKAEQYDPDNAYVNYYRALLIAELSSPDMYEKVCEEALREIRAGNGKKYNRFYFPPPLEPYADDAVPIRLFSDAENAAYYDQWNYFGIYQETSVRKVLGLLLANMQWSENKDDIQQLMYFLYRLGDTRPFGRSFFSIQLELLTNLQMREDTSSEDGLKLASAARFLNQQYFDLAKEMLDRRILSNPRQLDVLGVGLAESRVFRQTTEVRKFQRREAAYLKRAGEILDMDFDLPEDPTEW